MTSLSLQVWYALKRPPIHHPLFRRVSRMRQYRPDKRLSTLQRGVIYIGFLGLSYVLLRYFTQLIFVVIFFLPIGLTALYIALHGTLAGIYWALRISSAIAREREHGTYDLLSTSPYGAFSASWAICTGCQYYDQTFNGSGMQRVWFSRIFFLGLLLFSGLIELVDPRSYGGKPLEGFGYILAIVLVLTLAFYLDDIQSTVLGSLAGLIVPQIARTSFDARVGALALFLLLQVTAYSLVLLVGFWWMPQINDQLGVTGFSALILLPLEQLLIFFGVREIMGRVLWRLNYLVFDGDVSDLRRLTKGGRLIW